MSSLHTHYGSLDTIERLALLLRAVGRGDKQEEQAVFAASPRVASTVSDLQPHLIALEMVNMVHHLSQTDIVLAVMMSKMLWDKEPAAQPTARYLARRYVVAEAAWRSVCEEVGFDYDSHAARILDAETVGHRRVAAAMEVIALTDEECEAWSGMLPGTDIEMSSPQTLEEMRSRYEVSLTLWAQRHSPA